MQIFIFEITYSRNDLHIGWLTSIRDSVIFNSLFEFIKVSTRFDGLKRLAAASNHFNKVCYVALCRDRISTLSNFDIIHRLCESSGGYISYIQALRHPAVRIQSLECSSLRDFEIVFRTNAFVGISLSTIRSQRNIIAVKKWVTCQSLLSAVSLPEIILPERLFWHKNGWTLIKHLRPFVCRLLRKSINAGYSFQYRIVRDS